MAEVFRARDTRSGAVVAIKRILPTIAEDEDFVEMFLDEAKIASELEHPHIARLLDFGEVDQAYFIAYELVDGKDLRAIFDRAIEESEPPPLPFLLYVFTRVAEGLAYAHARKDRYSQPISIVHRDVSPQNVVVSYTGDVKLIDFGIAKARGRISKTSAGTIKGKFGYMSPEQISGDDVDQRTDVFSLGICMWELLTLKRLFSGPNEILVLDMVKRHVPDPPSAFRGDLAASVWGGELDRIVMKALAKDANERYKSARELFKDLYVFVEKSGAIATRDDVARVMRASFREEALRSLGSTMELQESRMSDDSNKGLAGSDLDIFEGLGKKAAPPVSAATPPPPPASGNLGVKQLEGMKKTLVGLSTPSPLAPPSGSSLPALPPPSSPPPASQSVRVANPASQPPSVTTQSSVSKPPPPPPGRGSLPNIGSTPPSVTAKAVPSAATTLPGGVGPSALPPPPSTRPTLAGRPSAPPPLPGSASAATSSGPNAQKLDMDWTDDEEATHVFDKESRDKVEAAHPTADRGERADMDAILSAPPPPPAAGTPAAPATMSGAFAQLGTPQSNGSSPPSAAFRSGPPASQSIRSAPPPPPGSFTPPPPSVNGSALPPPPPPPGQTTTAPMHMPPRPPSGAPGPMSHGPSSMPAPAMSQQHPSHHPQTLASQPPVHMPPVSRAMEATAMVPRQQASSKAPLIIGLLLAVAAVVGAGVFFLMPRTGTLVVNVEDSKGGAVSGIEVTVDGTKQSCSSAPCKVPELAKGTHEVKVTATGYDTPAARGVTIESGKDERTDFKLNASSAAKTAAGTGVHVNGSQPGVKLSIDGKEIGALPQDVKDLEPGEHKLHFAGDRYAPMDKTVSVGKDEMVDLGNVQLKVTKGKATIQLGTPGAKVYLVSGTNRREVPSFPLGIDFDTSEKWQLEAKLAGYDDFSQPISFDDGQAEKTFTIQMNPKGQKPANTTAAPATNPVAAAPADPKPAAPVAAADPKPAPAAAAGGDEAFLNINSLPASTVVLDGKPLGPTPKVHVSVTPGSHTILFVNAEQSLKKTVSVTVKGGETKPVTAKLRD